MAQRYTFTDDSGDVRISGFLDPEPPGSFNGGTITEPLTVAPAVTEPVALYARVVDDNTANIYLLNDAWDTDPSDYVGIISTSNAGDVDIHLHSGRTLSFTGLSVVDLTASVAVRFWQKAAPTDAVLQNSTFVFWLDDTVGATKLMVKAKDSAGTVRSAAIALA